MDPLHEPAVLIEAYGPLVTNLCRSFFRNEDDAREASQEAWLTVLASLKDFRGESRFQTWLFTVVYRRVLRIKQEARRLSLRELRENYHGTDFEAPASARPDLQFWVMETCRNCLKGVLFCLESEARLVFLFRFVVDLSYPQIAGIMQKSEPAVRQLASRARRTVGRFLSGECGLTRPGATCRCRNDRWVKETHLQARFARLGRVVQLAELYRNAGKVFPGRNYWEGMLGGDPPSA